MIRGRQAASPQARSLIEGALPEICNPVASNFPTTSHSERPMRELNRRTDIGESGVEKLLHLRVARLYNLGNYDRAGVANHRNQA